MGNYIACCGIFFTRGGKVSLAQTLQSYECLLASAEDCSAHVRGTAQWAPSRSPAVCGPCVQYRSVLVSNVTVQLRASQMKVCRVAMLAAKRCEAVAVHHIIPMLLHHEYHDAITIIAIRDIVEVADQKVILRYIYGIFTTSRIGLVSQCSLTMTSRCTQRWIITFSSGHVFCAEIAQASVSCHSGRL